MSGFGHTIDGNKTILLISYTYHLPLLEKNKLLVNLHSSNLNLSIKFLFRIQHIGQSPSSESKRVVFKNKFSFFLPINKLYNK